MLGPPSRFLHQRVEAERREVTLVEDDRVAQCNRLAVVRLVCEQIEQGLRAVAVASIPGHQPGAIDREGSYGLEGHRVLPPACKIRARSQGAAMASRVAVWLTRREPVIIRAGRLGSSVELRTRTGCCG